MKKYKVTKLAPGKPQIRFYPNNFEGDLKKTKSYRIFFDVKTQNIDKIIDQIHEGYEAKIISSLKRDGLSPLITKYAKN